MRRETCSYKRRASHRRHIGLPLNIDTRNLNRRKPVWRPRWVTLATVAAFWTPAIAYLVWVVR